MSNKASTSKLQTRPLLRLRPYLTRYRSKMGWGAGMVVLTNFAAVLSPWILRSAIDTLQSGQITRDHLLFYAGLLLGLNLFEGSFRYLMRRVLIGVSRQVEFDLRNDLFAHLQLQSTAFFQRYSTGDLMARCTNDLSAVRSVLGPGIMYSINTAFSSLLTVAFLLHISPRLTLLTLIPLLAVTLSVKYFGRLIHQRFERIQEQFSWITTLVQENVSGIRVVKAYNQERAFAKRFDKANQEYFSRSLALVRVQGIFQPLLTFLLGVSSVALLWYGGIQVVAGEITLGDFVAFLAYLAMLTWPTIALGYVINLFERGSASMGRLTELLDAIPEIRDRASDDLGPIRGALEIRDLTFSYNGTAVLKNITLEVPPGNTLAIVGRTGSGKSTLANLLCRLYPVSDGTIFIDGVDINAWPLQRLRQSIGYAPQDAFLFSESIAESIAFGNPEASQEEIEEVARVSNILPDINDFPHRYETFVGERGITLSGGQKQRVTISRALLVKPRILILDDSLSAVDTQTEEQILRELSEQLVGRTSILISHRISTIKMADSIVVLENGRLVEKGTHQELMAEGGYYADLYEQQLLKEQLDIE